MPEVGGTVETSFQIRSINSDVTSGQDAARTVANNTIDAVDDVLDSLRDEGGTALEEALAAIEALGAFSPGSISFSYQIPDYLSTNFLVPSKFEVGDINTGVTQPDTGVFSFQFSAPTLATPTGAKPPQLTVQTITAPSTRPTVGVPVAPVVPELSVGSAPELGALSSISLDSIKAPELADVVLPVFAMPALPTYEVVSVENKADAQALLDNAVPVGKASAPSYIPRFSAFAFWRDYIGANVRAFTLSGQEDLSFKWLDVLSRREVELGTEAWTARGWKLDDATMTAQQDYRVTMGSLLATKERNLNIATQTDLERVKVWKEAEETVKFFNRYGSLNYATAAKIDYDISSIYASAAMDTIRAVTALYSAMISAFNLEVMQYKASLGSVLGQLEQWKTVTKAEISKGSLNDSLVRLYSSTVEAESVSASVYEAQVRILGAEVEAYKTRMEAFATQAEVARVKLNVYKGTVDAYIGSLAGHRAQFAQYEARVKGTIAENRVQEAKTQVSVAQIEAASANSVQASVAMEVESAALQLQSRAQGALYDNQKLLNSLETIKAQIASDTAKQSIAEWSANIQLTNVQNDAIAAEAQSAARYYQVASDSAYRASEQAMRAMLSASQAANIAQESGSRAAASIAQGAYSAMHVNASLTGSGRISGDESQDARHSSVISDYLDYSEDYQQILSA